MELFEDDPSEWPAQFQEIKKIDSLLRCSICFELFNIAVIVPACSHNYCSYCIRKHISYKKYCPTCFKPLLDTDLKCNRILDELVFYFKLVRKKLLDAVSNFTEASPVLINKKILDLDEYIFEPTQKFCSSGKISTKKASKVIKNPPEPVLSNNLKKCLTSLSSTADNPQNAPADSPIDCPVCKEQIAFKRINIHLDGCLKAQERSSKNEKVSTKETETIVENNQTKNSFPSTNIEDIKNRSNKKRRETANDLIVSSAVSLMKPLPKVCLDVLNEKQLRNKAKHFGLTSKGDRNALTRRINQYILLHNSQCDSTQPLTAQEIAAQVEKDEKQQAKYGYKPSVLMQTFDLRHSDDKKQEFALSYSNQYNKEFSSLIEEIKSRKKSDVSRLSPSLLSNADKENNFFLKASQSSFPLIEIDEQRSSTSTSVKIEDAILKQQNSSCTNKFNAKADENYMHTKFFEQKESFNKISCHNNLNILPSLDSNDFAGSCNLLLDYVNSPEKSPANCSMTCNSPRLFSSPFESNTKPISSTLIIDHQNKTLTSSRFQVFSPVTDNMLKEKKPQIAKKTIVGSKKGLKRPQETEDERLNFNKRPRKLSFENNTIKMNDANQFQSKTIIEIPDSDTESDSPYISGLSDDISLLVDNAVMNPYNHSPSFSKSDYSTDSS